MTGTHPLSVYLPLLVVWAAVCVALNAEQDAQDIVLAFVPEAAPAGGGDVLAR